MCAGINVGSTDHLCADLEARVLEAVIWRSIFARSSGSSTCTGPGKTTARPDLVLPGVGDDQSRAGLLHRQSPHTLREALVGGLEPLRSPGG